VDWKEVGTIAKEALEKIDIHLDLDALVEQMFWADKQLIAFPELFFKISAHYYG
jgi:ABC-type sugar transport system ATPase subunit